MMFNQYCAVAMGFCGVCAVLATGFAISVYSKKGSGHGIN